MKTNYSLVDTGNGRKLERFGDFLVIRPAKQAVWKPAFSQKVWEEASLIFEKGSWNKDVSRMHFEVSFSEVTFDLRPMKAGQLGIFPEQEANWEWLSDIVASPKKELPIINGFAFTGGSTLFSSTPRTAVCHVDGSKTSIKDARRNALISQKDQNNIRWIEDDVISFLEREVRRGKEYNGFIFDPPAFGRGKKGKEWKLTRDLPRLFHNIHLLARGCPEFILVTVHDPDLTANSLPPLFATIGGVSEDHVECGILELKAESGRHLPGGIFARWKKVR